MILVVVVLKGLVVKLELLKEEGFVWVGLDVFLFGEVLKFLEEGGGLAGEAGGAVVVPRLLFGLGKRFREIFGFVVQEKV